MKRRRIDLFLIFAILLVCAGNAFAADGYISAIEPNQGSYSGGTMIHIIGKGFSGDQFNFDNPILGNQVSLINTKTRRTLGCSIITSDTTETRITCETRRERTNRNADYDVMVKVDGEWLTGGYRGSGCQKSSCRFYYRDTFTPVLKYVWPRSGVPMTTIALHGRILTTQISRQSPGFKAGEKTMEIAKIFVNDICEPFDAETGILLGAQKSCTQWHCDGWVKCQPRVKTAASWNASFIVSNAGNTQRTKDTYLVDGNDEAYLYQTYAAVDSVLPTQGSEEGGQLLTVTGKYFGNLKDNVQVSVQGVNCVITDFKSTEIKCRTGKAADSYQNETMFPGGRGTHMEVWTNTGGSSYRDLESLRKFNSTHPLKSYKKYIAKDFAQLLNGQFGLNQVIAKFHGFIVPPYTGKFHLCVNADDYGYLLLSKSGLRKDDLEKVAYTRSNTGNSFWRQNEQRSGAIFLRKDREYYYEAYLKDGASAYYLQLGLLDLNTKKTAAQAKNVFNEKQRIQLSSTHVHETQQVHVTKASGTFEVQLNGRNSDKVKVGADAATLTAALKSIFTTKCSYSPSGLEPDKNIPNANVLYYQNFEGAERGGRHHERGRRQENVPAYCGRKFLRFETSETIFYAKYTRKPDGTVYGAYKIKDYPHFCVAYYGMYQNHVNIRMNFKNKNSQYQAQSRTYNLLKDGRNMAGQWQYVCADLYKAITADSWLKGRLRSFKPDIKIDYIQLRRHSGHNERYIDEVYIGKTPFTASPSQKAILPKGFHISEVNVAILPKDDEKDKTTKYKIELRPTGCGSGLPLLKAVGSGVSVKRLLAGSGTLGGTFDVTYEGREVKDISVDIDEADLTARLEEELETGKLDVIYRNQECRLRFWDISWVGVGGDKPQMAVNGSKLVALKNPQALVTTNTNGGLMRIIPGEMLRTVHEKAQVVVRVNGLVSECAGNCSYEYTSSAPVVTAVSPTSGVGGATGACTQITVTCTGCSNLKSENEVWVGGVACPVISQTGTNIVCCPGASQAGEKLVIVNVAEVGKAKSSLMFKFTVAATSISPVQGTTTGGTHVSISGAGFGSLTSGVTVTIGTAVCQVTHVDMNIINCTTGAHGAEVANVNVKVSGESAPLMSNAFTYSEANTPKVTGFTNVAYLFGSNIQITGTGFGGNSRRRRSTDGVAVGGVTVTVGGANCNITSVTSTEINCQAPTLSPGNYVLKVDVADVGEAKYEVSNQIEYKLAIGSISPSAGSIIGGTEVTITGNGFSSNITENHVTIGGHPCTVTASSLTSLTCLTTTSRRHHYVSNNGIHNEYGLGYEWNVTHLFLKAGDDITWYWASNPLSKMKYGVLSVYDLANKTYDGTGFICQPRPSGQCDLRFSYANVYFFSSGVLTSANSHTLQGKLTVEATKEEEAVVQVSIGKLTVPASGSNGTFTKPNVMFSYAASSTPAITEIKSRRYKIDEEITVIGRHFSTAPSKNILKFGVHICKVSAATATQLKCVMETGTEPPMNRPLAVSLQVTAVGDAFIEMKTYFESLIWLDPILTSVAVNEGSFGGGTEVTITGLGFTRKSEIVLPDYLYILNTTYTELKVRSVRQELQNNPLVMNIALNVNNAETVCRDLKTKCSFTYKKDMTHTITSIEPVTAETENVTVTITGTKFGTDKSAIDACFTLFNGANQDVYVPQKNCPRDNGYCVRYDGTNENSGVTFLGKFVGTECLKACEARAASGHTVTACEEVKHGSWPNYGCHAHSRDIARGNNAAHYGCWVMKKCYVMGTCYKPCLVESVTDTEVKCAASGIVSGWFGVRVVRKPWGYAYKASQVKFGGTAKVSAVVATGGSVYGGALVRIQGAGFSPRASDHEVAFSGVYQNIVHASYSELIVRTRAAEGVKQVKVTLIWPRWSNSYPSKNYAYSSGTTPKIDSIHPKNGKSGESLTITGENFGTNVSDTTVTIGTSKCVPASVIATEIVCTLGVHPAGTYDVRVHTDLQGYSVIGAHQFTYDLVVTSVTPAESGYGGRRLLTVTGRGFSPLMNITVCGKLCAFKNQSKITDTEVECYSPVYDGYTSGQSTDKTCDTVVNMNTESKTLASHYTYKAALTSEVTNVSPSRGGTGGGIRVTITGTGFIADTKVTTVTIAGYVCAIKTITETEVVCITAPAPGRPAKTDVIVTSDARGAAYPSNASFWYIDVWSSIYSWGGEQPPTAGQFVIIPKGHTMLLDQSTPVLKILLIKGGTFMFDDEKDIELHAEHIMIVEGGQFLVGESPEKPYQHRATIMLHGHVRSKELPIYGAKTLSVRKGHLGLYGKHVMHTWTHIMKTLSPGDTTVQLKHPATDWNIGDEVVIPTSSKSQRENEVVKITGFGKDLMSVTIDPPVKYTHVSILQKIGDANIETRCEIGLLSRNIVVEGNIEQSWVHEIKSCPSDFDPGLFATQTCFDGKFGDERGSDQYGVQIMVHSHKKDKGMNMATAHFHYIEVRHCGQAFRLGRYPIHFHMEGDVHGSYVEGCGIHHSFNRAITMHGVHKLRVERNVFYNVMGNALFMEDGIETKNTVRYNLGIFVRPSSSALNVDISPATYWITNADNVISHNAAAGGSHFGYWLQLFPHPEGPNFDPLICPRKVPMTEFRNNSAHSFAVNGLWVFPTYTPMKGGGDPGGCDATIPEPAHFEDFIAWNCLQGAEISKAGAVQLDRFILLDNGEAGVNYADAALHRWNNSAMIRDSIISGHSQISAEHGATKACTKYGLRGPHGPYLTNSNVTFHNFDRDGCVAIGINKEFYPGTELDGWPNDGGNHMKFEKIKYLNAPRKTHFPFRRSHIMEDLDGTLTGYLDAPGGGFVPWMNTLDPSKCFKSDDVSTGVPGAMCKGPMQFRRVAFNGMARSIHNPQNNAKADAYFTNEFGTDAIQYRKMSMHGYGEGWTGLGVVNTTFELHFQKKFFNISYALGIQVPYSWEAGEWMIIKHNFTNITHGQSTGRGSGKNIGHMPSFEGNQHGDFWYNNQSHNIHYLVKGGGARTINFRAYRCYFKDCIVPTQPPIDHSKPPGPPRDWSNVSSWDGAPSGFAGNGRLPGDGDNVMIRPEWHMMLDMKTPTMKRFEIYGILNLVHGQDHEIRAEVMFLGGKYGQLIVGTAEKPMFDNVLISLQGSTSTNSRARKRRDTIGQRYWMPNLGARALGIFAKAQFIGQPRKVYWTRLSKTLEKKGREITLVDSTDWQVGEKITISTSSFSRKEAETFVITAVKDNGARLTLDKSAAFKHHASQFDIKGFKFQMSAKVALLTRNIVIKGANSVNDTKDITNVEQYGCRVWVGRYSQSSFQFRGSAAFRGVQFEDCSQASMDGEEWEFPTRDNPEMFARYALVYAGLGDINRTENYVRGCSFVRGYNFALGVFGTVGVDIEDNTMLRTMGVWEGGGGDYVFNRNLFIDSGGVLVPGTTQFIGNVMAGGKGNPVAEDHPENFGVNFPTCADTNSHEWQRDNEVHACGAGIMQFRSGPPGCIRHWLLWKNGYGHYSWTPGSHVLEHMILADNKMAVFMGIFGASSLRHVIRDSVATVRSSVIIGTSSNYECKDGAVAGFMSNKFSITNPPNCVPKEDPRSYPMINGVSHIHSNVIMNFNSKCGGRSFVNKMQVLWGDYLHPAEFYNNTAIDIDQKSIVKYTVPTTELIRPADCVDLDCEATRKWMIHDKDGSLTGKAGTQFIPKSEYEWDGNRAFGLGDYRIPKTMVTTLKGKRIDANKKFPNKGIIRGRGGKTQCVWVKEMFGYRCEDMDIMALVLESMDKDTEDRRLGPIGIGAMGYIDLLNGPQDHGWCNGWFCLKRLSTYNALVGANTITEVYLSSTNPQKFRMKLLNVNMTKSMIVEIFYADPQRLDIYRKNLYVYPTNAYFEKTKVKFSTKDQRNPTKYIPSFTTNPGANWFDLDSNLLYVLMRGDEAVEIRTMPVVQLRMGTEQITVAVDDFFEENIVRNLAALLFIKPENIRVMNVISANQNKRKRKRRAVGDASDEGSSISIQFGEPAGNNTNSTDGKSTSGNRTELLGVSSKLVEVTQSGKLSEEIGIKIDAIDVKEPEPEEEVVVLEKPVVACSTKEENKACKNVETTRILYLSDKSYTAEECYDMCIRLDDCSGFVIIVASGRCDLFRNGCEKFAKSGHRFYNKTDCTQTFAKGFNKTGNGTLTMQEKQKLKEAEKAKESEGTKFLIPKQLQLLNNATVSKLGYETVPLAISPELQMYDSIGRWVKSLGTKLTPWILTVSLVKGTGHADAYLMGNVSTTFVNGTAKFTDLAISHAASGYKLLFKVTYPTSVSFSVEFGAIEIKERVLKFTFDVKSISGIYEMQSIAPSFAVAVTDTASGDVVTNTGWKGRKWILEAVLVGNGNPGTLVDGTSVANITDGRATLANVSINTAGTGYQIKLKAYTIPSSNYVAEQTTSTFDIKERTFYLRVASEPSSCFDTLACVQQPVVQIRSHVPDMLATNLGRAVHVNTTLCTDDGTNPLLGTNYQQIPASGEIQFRDLRFQNIGSGYNLCFNVSVSPDDAKFASLSAATGTFNVAQRQFYLHVDVPPGGANESAVFGEQPVVSVRVQGSTERGYPLPENMTVTVAISKNTGGGVLSGNLTVPVSMDEQVSANFSDLAISKFGAGYEFTFTCSVGTAKAVTSSPFNVRYKNFYAPVFAVGTKSTIHVAENSALALLDTFVATDQDTGAAGSFFYNLTGESAGTTFSLNRANGEFRLAASVDREVKANYTLVVQAIDEPPSPFEYVTEQTVTVVIDDVNDNKPTFEKAAVDVEIKETHTVNSLVASVVATDLDAGVNSQIVYSVVSQPEQAKELFSLNAATGDITLAKSADLDASKAASEPTYTMVIEATDQAVSNKLSSRVTVNIKIAYVNEFTPAYQSAYANVTVREDQPMGYKIATNPATDGDAGIHGEVRYFVKPDPPCTTPYPCFEISNTGEITLGEMLDYDSGVTSYKLTLYATDKVYRGYANKGSATLRVNVEDVNDNKPIFSSSSCDVLVKDSTSIGTEVTHTTATDGDVGINGEMTFAVTSQNSAFAEMFSTSTKAGRVAVVVKGDLSKNSKRQTIDVKVTATDKGLPSQTATKYCKLTVLPPLVSKRLRLTFTGDFKSKVKGRETKFKQEFKTFYEARELQLGRVVNVSNIVVVEGSIRVDFDVEHENSQSAQLIKDLKSAITNNKLQFTFNAQPLNAQQKLHIDGAVIAVVPPATSSGGGNTGLIVGVVVVVILLLVLIVVLVYFCHFKGYWRKRFSKSAKKVDTIEMTGTTTIANRNASSNQATPSPPPVLLPARGEEPEVVTVQGDKFVNRPITPPSEQMEMVNPSRHSTPDTTDTQFPPVASGRRSIVGNYQA